MRVVSLLPSATEIICRVGGAHTLVGVSHECDHPAASVAGLPVLTSGRASYAPESGLTSSAVDEIVRTDRARGESLYRLDDALLAQLRPDVIVTQDLCDVCSIDLDEVRRVADRIAESQGSKRPEIVSLNPHTFEGVLDDHLTVGNAIGCAEGAREAVVEMRAAFYEAENHVNPYTDGPIVGFLEWTDPLFVAGHWTVELIERAAGRHPLNESVPVPGTGLSLGPQRGERRAGKSIAVPPELFAATKPDALVICPCGLTLDQAEAEARNLRDRAREQGWWNSLPAVQQGRVVVVDGNQMFNRPGPRLVDAFRWLVGWLNDRPELIPDGFPWEPLSGA